MAHYDTYDLIIDEERHSVRATLRGFWDMATVSSYLADLEKAGVRVSRGGASSWWLICIGAQVQAGEIAAAMGAMLPSILPKAATVAVLMGPGLSAMQVKRVVPNDHHRHFSDLAEAESWLSERGMPA